jgi:hypothetical protein
MRVIGTGVRVRLADEEELQAYERVRTGAADFEFDNRSYITDGGDIAGEADVYVVSQAFVEFEGDHGVERWWSSEHHGHAVSTRKDATLKLVELARDAEDDLVSDLLGDLRIAGHGVSRWEFVSAPRTYELDPELKARIAPLRRG